MSGNSSRFGSRGRSCERRWKHGIADMDSRTIEDRLRSEYFELLPHIRRVADETETEVRYLLMPVMRDLETHEKIVVRSRVKDCEGAIVALRRRPEYFTFDRSMGEPLSLQSL